MKPDKNSLIDYLYGEISEEKRLEIDLYFSQNPTEKIHLEALKNTQNILQNLKNKTPKQPLILMDMDNLTAKNTKNTTKNGYQNQHQSINTMQSQPFFNAFTRNFMGVAACLAFLFLSAYLTGFSIRQTDKGFEVAFGKNNQDNNQNQDKNQQQKPQLQPTDDKINQIVKNDNQADNQADNQKDTKFMENFISQKMKEKEAFYNHELSTLKNKVNNQDFNSFVSNSKGITNGTKDVVFSNKEVQEMLKQVREQDFEMMRGFISANNAQQSEYVNNAFKSFAEYWEGKRQQDLSAIGTSIATFKDEAKEKFKENDVILTRLTQK